MKIGRVQLKSNLILAPMAGVSDLPFRILNREFGCELAWTEMLNVRSLSHKSRKSSSMLTTLPEDKPLGVQILGCEKEFILKALDVLKDYRFELLDFNAACPVEKVVRRGEGAALLKDPKKLKKLLRFLVKRVLVPVTVKIRVGWDNSSVNARETALAAEDAGVSAIFIHGRTREQGYGAGIDYPAIQSVKEAVAVPVVASGDIFSPEQAGRMLEETGCDGLLVARGALGNPWIFKSVETFLKSGKLIKKPGRKEIARVMSRHLKSCIDFDGERVGVMKFRKFFIWYTKGFSDVRRLRSIVFEAKKEADMLKAIEAL